MRRRKEFLGGSPEFGWLAGAEEDDSAKDALRLGRPGEDCVGIRGSSGVAQRGVFGFRLLWKLGNWLLKCGWTSAKMGSSPHVCLLHRSLSLPLVGL